MSSNASAQNEMHSFQ